VAVAVVTTAPAVPVPVAPVVPHRQARVSAAVPVAAVPVAAVPVVVAVVAGPASAVARQAFLSSSTRM
jgi:hypothetical protein